MLQLQLMLLMKMKPQKTRLLYPPRLKTVAAQIKSKQKRIRELEAEQKQIEAELADEIVEVIENDGFVPTLVAV